MWLSDFQVVLPDAVLPTGSVRLEDGCIAEIVDRPVADAEFHGDGMLLVPGLVDLHGDMIEREVEPRPGAGFPMDMAVIELDKRLASAGVTTAFVAVSFSDGITTRPVRSEVRAREIIHTVLRLNDATLTDMHVHARFEVNNERAAPVLYDLIAEHAVDLVSLTDHTPGQGQYRDIENYVRFVAKWRGLDHAEVAAKTQQRLEERAAKPQTWDIVREVTGLARTKGLPIASHDDDTVEKVDLMQDLGASISEFPVTLEAAHEARRRNMVTVMGAPNALRGQSNTGNLGAREAISAGVLDALAADYHPGAMLRAALTVVDMGMLPLHRAIALVTDAPAKAVGLDDRGAIAVGRRADLAMVEQRPIPRVRATLTRGRFSHAEVRAAASPPSPLRRQIGDPAKPAPAGNSADRVPA